MPQLNNLNMILLRGASVKQFKGELNAKLRLWLKMTV